MVDMKRNVVVIAFTIIFIGLLTGCQYMPMPMAIARLVRAKIISCKPLDEEMLKRTAFWREEVKKLPGFVHIRKNWEEGLADMLYNNPGILLEIEISEAAWIFRNNRFGSRREITVGPWEKKAQTTWVFSNEYGSECSRYPIGTLDYYLETTMDRANTPPIHPAEFLDLYVLQRVSTIFNLYLPENAFKNSTRS